MQLFGSSSLNLDCNSAQLCEPAKDSFCHSKVRSLQCIQVSNTSPRPPHILWARNNICNSEEAWFVCLVILYRNRKTKCFLHFSEQVKYHNLSILLFKLTVRICNLYYYWYIQVLIQMRPKYIHSYKKHPSPDVCHISGLSTSV